MNGTALPYALIVLASSTAWAADIIDEPVDGTLDVASPLSVDEPGVAAPVVLPAGRYGASIVEYSNRALRLELRGEELAEIAIVLGEGTPDFPADARRFEYSPEEHSQNFLVRGNHSFTTVPDSTTNRASCTGIETFCTGRGCRNRTTTGSRVTVRHFIDTKVDVSLTLLDPESTETLAHFDGSATVDSQLTSTSAGQCSAR